MDEGGFDFNTFFIDRCKYYNRAFCAPPGVHLPEAGAAALNDFIVFATQITEIKVGKKNIEG